MIELPVEVMWSDGLSRVVEVGANHLLRTPAYFPAVSGASMSARPLDMIKLVIDTKYPRVLVSAYDLAKLERKQQARVASELRRFRAAGGFVFLDCGMFESYWLRDERWDFRHYEKVVHAFEQDFHASFDGVVRMPPVRGLSMGFQPLDVTRSIGLAPDSQCVLIAHATTPERLVKAVTALAKFALANRKGSIQTSPLVLAVAERECGTGVAQRAGAITAIRRSLDQFEVPALLHVLGCGYPVSIAAYSSAGADSFDSRDWSEAAIDWRNFSTVDFSLLSATGCPCKVCKKFRIDNLQKGFLHNLLFYQTFSIQLHRMIRERTLDDFLLETLGATTFRSLKNAIGKRSRSR